MFARSLAATAIALLVGASTAIVADAATFTFGGLAAGQLRNGLNGGPEDIQVVLSDEGFSLTVAAGPAGARLAETSSAGGLGVSSGAVTAGVIDGGVNVFDVLKGSLAGTSEFIRFSFDQPGLLTGINFDGISDDALEYFVLESPNTTPTYFFDVDANNTVAGAVDQAIALGIVAGHVVYLLDDPPDAPTDLNDEIYNLHIPFAGGQEFTLTYRELTGLGPQYVPAQAPNGSRFQQFIVADVPEPATSLLAVLVAGILGFARRHR